MSAEDRSERERVYSRIAPMILEFKALCASSTFHVEQLRRFVLDQVPEIAPDSPGRILRLLRQEGHLDYVVINRRASLYQFRAVVAPQPQPEARMRDDLFDA